VDPVVFRENDIRGRAGLEIALSEVFSLALAVGSFFRRNSATRVVVGRDARPTSRAWLREVIGGLTASGCDAVDIGSCLTPCMYFGVRYLDADAGVMVTASHNAVDYNGLKLVLAGEPVHGADIREIQRIFETGDFVRGRGHEEQVEIDGAYVDALIGDLTVTRRLRVGIDAGHGTAAKLATRLLEALGVEAVPVRPQLPALEDGHFVDPAQQEDLETLSRFVRARSLDLGVAFDGDGDRLGVIGPTGAVIPADDLLILFARDLLAKHPGAGVVAEVLCSQRLFDEVERLGGRPTMWKTGHSLVREKMVSEGALLAGELSGHFFFADRYPASSDAIYACGRLLEILSTAGVPIQQLLADLPPVARFPQVRIKCEECRKEQVMTAVTRTLGEMAAQAGATIVDVDGLRVVWPNGWAVVRASNTEPAIVVRYEASDEPTLRSIRSKTMAGVDAALREENPSKIRAPLDSRRLALREP
jgi:phosphomannomutase / phosphoglucomutase